MAQATQNRPSSASRWSLRPPQVRLNRTSAGALLALSAWLMQSYLGSLDASRIELRDALRSAEARRETWLIEYNSSLVRQPRSERVTARAALQLVESTRECLALAEVAGQSPFTIKSDALQTAHDDIAHARLLFEGHEYRDLQAELESVTTAYGKLQEAGPKAGSPFTAGFDWWRHAVPFAFLLGIGLCLTGGRHAMDD